MGTLACICSFLIVAIPIAAILAYLMYAGRPGTLSLASRAYLGQQWPVSRACFAGVVQARFLITPLRGDLRQMARSNHPGGWRRMVFVCSGDGSLYAVDLAGGQLQWRFEADDSLEASPLLVDGSVYVGSVRGTFYAIDAATGSQQWIFYAKGKIVGSANTFQDTATGRQRVVFGGYDNTLYCLDAQTGQGVWTQEAKLHQWGCGHCRWGDGVRLLRRDVVCGPLDEPAGPHD